VTAGFRKNRPSGRRAYCVQVAAIIRTESTLRSGADAAEAADPDADDPLCDLVADPPCGVVAVDEEPPWAVELPFEGDALEGDALEGDALDGAALDGAVEDDGIA